MESYYFNTDYSPQCLDLIKKELNQPRWYISPFGVERSDLSKELRAHVQSVLPFKISDVGFLRRRPKSMYRPHIDPMRTFAFNILMSDEGENSGTYIVKVNHHIVDNTVDHIISVSNLKVNYIKDQITVLNVKQIHYTVNDSDNDRIVLSIGCNESSYNEIIKTVSRDIIKL
jgi:hypothetical protein